MDLGNLFVDLVTNSALAKKLFAPKPIYVPEWTESCPWEIAALARWHIDYVPGELKSPLDAFRRYIKYPFPGAYFSDEALFCFVLPQGTQRGYVYRETGGESVDDLRQCKYIMYEVVRYVEARYATEVKSILDTERAKEQAKRDLEAFAADFKAKVSADAASVVATLQAGGQASLKPWMTDPALKPPAALYEKLQKLIVAAEKDVERARSAVESERLSQELERKAAVWKAEQEVAAAKEAARVRLLASPIPLAGLVPGSIVLGTRVSTGELFSVDLRKLRHLLLCGVSGAGKSVLLHQIVYQMVQMPEFEKIIAVDLKGGLEFSRYQNSGKVEVVWDFQSGDVYRAVDSLMQLASERQTYMRQNGLQNWPMHGRIALVIDEFAEVQTEIDTATEKEEKAKAKRLAANLLSLARRARALGIILLFAVQKATSDAMDSSLFNNLGNRLVMRSGARHTARALLDIGIPPVKAALPNEASC